jgi:hypothetical protein
MKNTKTFVCKGRIIQITVDILETLDMSRNKVVVAITAKYRDYHSVTYFAENPFKYGAPLQVLQNEEEFWNDIQNQINYLNNTPSPQTVLEDHINACLNSIHQHIIKYNRLIDSDMEMLVDCAMHILDASHINIGLDMVTIRKGIMGAIIEQYGSRIYFVKNSLFGQPELIKLKQ